MSDKKINTIHDLQYIGVALDWFYQQNHITPQIEQLPPIPLESTWSLRPFICGCHINRFRLVEGSKVISIVLEWFNTYQELKDPYYSVLPLKASETEEKHFSIEEVQELHDYIKSTFEKWDES